MIEVTEVKEVEKNCCNCKYTNYGEADFPCNLCKRSAIKGSKEYNERKNYWKSQYDKENDKNDLVIHPNHYNKEGRKECWDEMIEIFGSDAVAIFDVLSAYKYHYRAGNKDGNPEEQDLKKIDNYMKHSSDIIISGIIPTTSNNTKLAAICHMKMRKILDNKSVKEIK